MRADMLQLSLRIQIPEKHPVVKQFNICDQIISKI